MIDSITRITLNLQESSNMVSIKAKRGDTARKLLIHLSDSGIPYHISEECYATFTAKKPDGNKINNPCTIENNVIEYQFTEQTCSAIGMMKAEIRLYGADDKMITSACFLISIYDTVFHDGDEVESEAEMTTLDALIIEANELIHSVQTKLDNGEFVGEPGPAGVSITEISSSTSTSSPAAGVPETSLGKKRTFTIHMSDGSAKQLVYYDGANGTDGCSIYPWDMNEASSYEDDEGKTHYRGGVILPEGRNLKEGDLLLADTGDVYRVEYWNYITGMAVTHLFSILCYEGNGSIDQAELERLIAEYLAANPPAAGKDGEDGADGLTPYVGDNGNWYLGDTDTGKPSRGETGPQGEKGDTGAVGPQGEKGDKGDKGDPGEQGPAGPQGVQGEAGPIGPAGPQGEKGDTGPQGERGSAGPAGSSGVHILSDGETLEDVPEDVNVVIDPNGNGGAQGILVTGATVGQTVKIAAVDENGVPTAWEAVEFPEGGGGGLSGTPVWETLFESAIPSGTDAGTVHDTAVPFTSLNDYYMVEFCVVSTSNTDGEWKIIPGSSTAAWALFANMSHRGKLIFKKIIDNYWHGSARRAQNVSVGAIKNYDPYIGENGTVEQSERIYKFPSDGTTVKFYNASATTADCTIYVRGVRFGG